MPCSDSLALDRHYQETATAEKNEKIRHLTARNNELMKAICAIDTWIMLGSGPNGEIIKTAYHAFLAKSKDLSNLVLDHRVSDSKRRYEHYRDKYPMFSEEEINKMVIAGVLPDA